MDTLRPGRWRVMLDLYRLKPNGRFASPFCGTWERDYTLSRAHQGQPSLASPREPTARASLYIMHVGAAAWCRNTIVHASSSLQDRSRSSTECFRIRRALVMGTCGGHTSTTVGWNKTSSSLRRYFRGRTLSLVYVYIFYTSVPNFSNLWCPC